MHWFGKLGKLSTKVIDNSGKLPVTLGLWAVIRKLGKWYYITLGLCGITLRVMPYGTTASTAGKGLELWLWLVHNPRVMVITSKLRIITPGLPDLDEYILKIKYIPSPIAPWSSPYASSIIEWTHPLPAISEYYIPMQLLVVLLVMLVVVWSTIGVIIQHSMHNASKWN